MRKIQMVDLKGQYNGIKDVVNPAIQEIIENRREKIGDQKSEKAIKSLVTELDNTVIGGWVMKFLE